MLAKMWRVYQIFHNPKPDKTMVHIARNKHQCTFRKNFYYIQRLKDQHVMVIILAVTGVAVLLLLLETAIPYLRGSITRERDMENLSGETVCNM